MIPRHFHGAAFLVCAVALLTLLTLGGCGPSSNAPARYRVSGTVSFDGAPLKSGDIQFVSTSGDGAVDAGTITNGTYAVEATPGAKQVKITASRIVPGKDNPGIPGTPVYEDFIPAPYNESTTLEAEIKANGNNTANFELQSK